MRTLTDETDDQQELPVEPLMITTVPKTLPELLTSLDQMAIPVTTSLDEIGSLLAADDTLVKITPFSLESTLDWLEGKATGQPMADTLDASLVNAMPDDPDEAQVWLEQMAGEVETVTNGDISATVAEVATALDLTEADLLDMPEDPDAAIAWIESLAAKRERGDS
ncbi:MAG: hypothetical protein R3C44_09005 [Chloroflexota bacterium]